MENLGGQHLGPKSCFGFLFLFPLFVDTQFFFFFSFFSLSSPRRRYGSVVTAKRSWEQVTFCTIMEVAATQRTACDVRLGGKAKGGLQLVWVSRGDIADTARYVGIYRAGWNGGNTTRAGFSFRDKIHVETEHNVAKRVSLVCKAAAYCLYRT